MKKIRRVQNEYYVRILFTFFLVAVSINTLRSQPLNYRQLFGDDWNKAQTFVDENKNWMEPILTGNHISYPLAVAVIFPELVRYSALRDKMEITLLKALYINLGDEYANFSIGHFQMKPSFAEVICDNASSLSIHISGIKFKSRSQYDNISDFRKSIVTDLEDPKTQFTYLVAFFKICEKKYKTNRKNDESRLKFLATAYNYGIKKSAGQIDSMIVKKFFNTILFKTENYSYADVSLYWYNQYMTDK